MRRPNQRQPLWVDEGHRPDVGERDQLYRFADNRVRTQGPDAMRDYVAAKNGHSLDGLPGLVP